MKELLLLRHAKALKGDTSLKDFDRPLSEVGEQQLSIIAEVILKEKIIPDHILSSSAKRARQTAEGVAKEIGYKKDFSWTDELYECQAFNYIDLLSKLPDNIERVMLVGHNPTHEEIINWLARTNQSLSTGALAYLKFSIQTWKELTPNTEAKLINIWRPKDIM